MLFCMTEINQHDVLVVTFAFPRQAQLPPGDLGDGAQHLGVAGAVRAPRGVVCRGGPCGGDPARGCRGGASRVRFACTLNI